MHFYAISSLFIGQNGGYSGVYLRV